MTTAGPEEREVLLARIDELERLQQQSKPSPVWKNTALVGLIGTLVAVLPPSLTAIHGYYETKREVENARLRLEHERSLAYLDRALSPEPEEAKQAQVLRFLSAVPDDEDLRKWAADELGLVEESIKVLKQQIAANEDRIARLQKEKESTIDQTAAVVEAAAAAEPGVTATAVQVAQIAVDDTNREIEQLHNDTLGLKVRTGQVSPAAMMAVASAHHKDETVQSPRRASQWRLRLPSPSSNLEGAKGQVAKARAAGAEEATIYRKNGLFYVLVERFTSQEQALDHVKEARSYLDRVVGGLIRPVDVMEWCSSQTLRQGYTDCT